ncbi:MAG: PorV/PorQ family protein [Chitinispirillaceae bacterium]|nr:PorV/PorQ family protein [Chitinispirillaceae bacterium]
MIIGFLAGEGQCALGQSAVITLVFPPGARATGLGEAFTGLANDVNAIFFNPAGLGREPLANSWKSYLDGKGPFVAVASKHKSEFMVSEVAWAGTASGVLRYNGKTWEDHEIYLVELGDDIRTIARRYLGVAEEKLISGAVWKIRAANGIEMKRYTLIKGTLKARLDDSLLADAKTDIETITRNILDLPAAERTAVKIAADLSAFTDTVAAAALSEEIAVIIAKKDKELIDFVELRVPFSIAVNDSVTAMAMDMSERLWVGTKHGLWRQSESKWSRITASDGLPSDVITAIALGKYGELAVGTDAGIGIYKDGAWSRMSSEEGLPDRFITAVSFGKDGVVYAGSASGMAIIQDSKVTLFDTSNGLLALRVNALCFDSRDRLWVGGENGVAIYNGEKWQRFKFPGSIVQCFTERGPTTMWIGTDRGAISHREEDTLDGEALHEWKPFHSKNVLHGDMVYGMAAFGNDVWIATDRALNKYQWAQMQAMMFYEPLLPAFRLKELWHTFGAFVFPTEDWGTFGVSINFINMGKNEWTDELGKVMGEARSYELVFGPSYGLPLTQTLSAGLNMKAVISALAPGYNGAGVGMTFAIDAAILKRGLFLRDLDVGFMLQNMGPAIYYIDEDEKDPIPFTLRLGAAYKAVQTQIHDLTFLLDLNREVVKNYPTDKPPDPFWVALWTDLLHDKDESAKEEIQLINVNLGIEYWYSRFLALRTGFLGDYLGERYELTFGLGLNYGNLNFDWSYILSPEGFLKGVLTKINPSKLGSTGARHGQWRASFLFKL